MKKFKKFCCAALIICMLTALVGCAAEPPQTVSASSGCYPYLNKDMVLDESEIILRGTPTKVTRQYFTCDEDNNSIFTGEHASNVQVTEYEVEVEETYKGSFSGETILVKRYNGHSLSEEEFLTGRNGEYTISVSADIREYLDLNQEYILGIMNPEEGFIEAFGDDGGYSVYFALPKDETGNYSGKVLQNDISLCLETLRQDIIDAPANSLAYQNARAEADRIAEEESLAEIRRMNEEQASKKPYEEE